MSKITTTISNRVKMKIDFQSIQLQLLLEINLIITTSIINSKQEEVQDSFMTLAIQILRHYTNLIRISSRINQATTIK